MKKKLFFLIVAICVLVAVLAACDNKHNVPGTESNDPTYTVTFMPENGEEAVTISATLLSYNDCPLPTREGYVFGGWRYNSSMSVVFPVTLSKDMTLYAIWVEQTVENYTAVFVTNGGTAVGSVTGQVVTEAPATEKAGFTFEGWYLNEALSTPARFPYAMTEDTSFYAKFSLSGVSYDTDEEANTIVFKWPAADGEVYKWDRGISSSEKHDCLNVGGTASFSVRDPGNFSINIYKQTDVGLTNIYSNTFYCIPTFRVEDAGVELRGDEVFFSLPESKYVCQISLSDVLSNNEVIYSANGNSFSLPASYFLSSKKVNFRYAFEGGSESYYSLRSSSLYVKRLASPKCEYYRDGDFALYWSGVADTQSYTLSFFAGDRALDVRENVLVRKTESNGYIKYDLSPQSLFPNGDYAEFGVEVIAEGKTEGNQIFLSSEKSPRMLVSYVGTADISLQDDKISWVSLYDASSYTVNVTHNKVSEPTDTNRTEPYYLLNNGGEYTISVKPNAKLINSFSVTATASYNLLELPFVSTTLVTGGVTFMWENVPNATGYSVMIVDHETHEVVSNSKKTQNEVRICSYDQKDFPVGLSEVWVTAIGDGERYQNSPATVIAIHRFRTPDITFEVKDALLSVNVDLLEHNAHYFIDHTSVKGHDDSESGENSRTIEYELVNEGTEDKIFSMSVYATSAFAGSGATTTSTHYYAEAPLYYIDSDKVTFEVERLCRPENFTLLSSPETFSWTKEAGEGKAEFQVKLDSKSGDGVILPIGSTELDLTTLLAAYDKDVLDVGDHTVYLRRVMTEADAIPSDYVELSLTKLAAVSGLKVEEQILRWEALGADGLTGYGVLVGIDPDVITYSDQIVVTGTNYQLDSDVVKNESTELYYRVVSLGRFYDTNNKRYFINSEPSDAFLVRRLKQVEITIRGGIMRWEKGEADSFTLYDDSLVLAEIAAEDDPLITYDLKDIAVGDHRLTVVAHSDNSALFDAPRSWVHDVRRLSIPVLAKRELEDYLFDVGIVEDYDLKASSYCFYTDEIEGNVSVSKEASRTYRFVPESYGVLAAGLYHLTAQAIGNGVTTITSPMSAEITYYKIATPAPYVNYLTEYSQWDIGDIQDCYVIDEYEGLFQEDTFKRTDRSADLFLSYDLKPCAKAGNNTFFLKAKSHGNVTSEVGSVVAHKLSGPEIVVKALTLESDVEVVGEWYRYTVNGSDEKLSTSNVFPFSDMNLHVDINDLTFIRKADDHMASDPTEYPLRKLRAPQPGVDWTTEEIAWEAIPYAAEYSYWVEVEDPTEEELSRVNVSRLTNLLRATLSYGAGRDLAVREHVFTIYALCDGCVPSEQTAIRVYKLASPEISRDGLDFSWETPVDADRYLVYLNGNLMDTVLGSDITPDYKYSVDIDDVRNGSNTFTVVAKGTERITAYASNLPFERLLPPVLRVEKNTVLWDAVSHATTYEYSLEGAQQIEDTTANTSVYFSSDKLVVGENPFTIVARADGFIRSREASIVVTKLAQPVVTVTKNVVSWAAIPGAEGYYYTLNDGAPVYLSAITKTFGLSELNVGENVFTIYAAGNNNVDSEVTSGTIYKLAAPALNVTKNVVTWAPIQYADKYYYTLNDEVTPRETTACTVTFTPAELKDGDNVVKFYAFDADGNYANSLTSETVVRKLAKPVVTQTKNNITWNAVENAASYVYALNGTGDTQTTRSLSYDKSVFNVGGNIFTIYAQGGNYLESDTVTVTIIKLAQPVLTVNKETVSWAAITGAEGYYYTLNGGDPVYLTATTKTFGLSELLVGENAFTIYAAGNNNVDSEVTSGKIYKLAAPALNVTKNVVTWAPIQYADKYYYTLNDEVTPRETTACTVTFTPAELKDGDNIVKVYAFDTNDNYANSLTSETIVSKLAKPVVTQTKNNLTWNAVENAASYVYALNGTGDTQTTRALSYDKSVFNVGANTFTIYAQGGNYLESDTVTVTITKLATPVLTVNKEMVSWAAISGAEGYYYTLNGSEKVYLASTSKTFALSDLNVGENVFTIYAVGNNNVDSEATSGTIYKLAAPALNVTKNVVTWAAIENAERYYYTLNNGAAHYTTDITVTFTPAELKDGDNIVKVYAFDTNDNYANSLTSETIVSKLAKPVVTQTKNNITWNAVENAASYVYALNGTGDTQTTCALSYDKGVFNVGANTFTIYAQGGNYLESDTVTVTITKLATPVLTVNKETVSWAAIAGAEGYYYTLNGGDPVYLTAMTKTFALSDLNVGANTFTIYAVGHNNVDSEATSGTIYKLAAPVLSVAKNVVSWEAIEKADRYYYSLNNGAPQYTTNHSVTFGATDLSDGTNFVRVYAYDEDDNYANSNTVQSDLSKLAKPVVTIVKNQVIVAPITGASTYKWTLNGASFDKTEASFTISLSDLQAGRNDLTVYAFGAESYSSDVTTAVITKLATPVLTADNDTVICTDVLLDAADGVYCYTLNGGALRYSADRVIPFTDLVAGEENTIVVYASGGNYADSASETIVIDKLGTPTVSDAKNVLTISSVENAEEYYYVLNGGTPVLVTESPLTIPASDLAVGANTVTVYAVAEGYAASYPVIRTITKLATPVPVVTENVVSWAAVPGATRYYYTFKGGEAQYTTATELTFSATDLAPGANAFTVYAVGEDVVDSAVANASLGKLDVPVLTVTKNVVSWTAIPGATGYYYTLRGGVAQYTTATELTFAASDLLPGTNAVTVYAVGGNNVDSVLASDAINRLAAPDLTVTKATVSWEAISGATGYYYTLRGGEAQYTTATELTFASTDLLPGANAVTVYAVGGNNVDSALSSDAINKLAAPALTVNKGTVSWEAISGATGYYYTLRGGEAQYTTDTSLTFTASDLLPGANAVTVYAVGGNNVDSAVSSDAINRLGAPASITLAPDATRVDWAAVTGADYYVYSIDGTTHITASTENTYLILSNSYLKSGANTFTVYAFGATYVDSPVTQTTVNKLAFPVVTVSERTLSFEAIAGATGYLYTVCGGEPIFTTSTSITIPASMLPVGTNDISLWAIGNGYAGSDAAFKQITVLAAPVVTTGAPGVANWAAVYGAEGYRYVLKDSSDNTLATDTVEANVLSVSFSFDTFAVGVNTLYVYSVAQGKITHSAGAVSFVKLAAPVLSAAVNIISWDAVPNATSYHYELKNAGTLLLDGDISATSYTVDLSSYGAGIYTFSLYAKATGYVDSEADAETVLKIDAPADLSVTASGVEWTAVSGAESYAYVISANAVEVARGTIDAPAHAIDMTALSAGTYTVSVYAVADGYVDSSATVAVAVVKLAAPTPSVTNTGVIWESVADATDYVYAVKDSSEVLVLSGDSSARAIDMSGLSAGTYTVTVYAKANGFVTSLTSNVSATKLQTPNAVATANEISISNAAEGVSYYYSLNDGAYLAVGSLPFTVPAADLIVGNNSITIYAAEPGKIDSDPCAALTVTKLAAPADLSVTASGVEWIAVSGAESYAYVISANAVEVARGTIAAPAHTIDMTALLAGTYTVTLYSTASGCVDSAASSITATKLQTPNASAAANVIWISNATEGVSYYYSLNDGAYLAVGSLPFTVPSADLSVGNNSITIYAAEPGKIDSDPCAALTVTKLAAPAPAVSASGVSWASVGESVIYHYSICAGSGDPIEGTTDALLVNLSSYAAGTYTVTVYAAKSGCVDSAEGEVSATVLSAPILTVTSSGVSWASVGESVIYHYSISAGSGDPIEGTTDALLVNLSSYAAGTYTVTVYAAKSGCITSASSSESIVIADLTLTLTGNVVTWDEVDGASEYRVYEGDSCVATLTEAPLEYTVSRNCTVTILACQASGFLVAASGSVQYAAAE